LSRAGARRRLLRYLWNHYGTVVDGQTITDCSFGCGRVLTPETATIDRYPIPGRNGGRYTKRNTRLACRLCNCADRCVPVQE